MQFKFHFPYKSVHQTNVSTLMLLCCSNIMMKQQHMHQSAKQQEFFFDGMEFGQFYGFYNAAVV
jgi:hypothetical protein